MADRLSPARVVADLVGVVRRNPASLCLMWLLTAAAVLVLDAGAGWLMERFDLVRNAVVDLLAGQVSGVGLFVSGGGIVLVVAADLQGRRVDAATAMVAALRLSGRMLGIGVFTAFVLGVATAALVVPGVVLSLFWFVTDPVRALEGSTVVGALRRSRVLTRGHRAPLFVLWLLLVIGAWTGNALTAAAGLDADLFSPDGGLTLPRVIAAAMESLYQVVAEIVAAVCYVSLRQLRDGDRPDQVAAVFT